MALELRLVHRDVLDADAVFVRVRLNDAVDQQKRIPVRQGRQEPLDVETLEHATGLVHFVPLSVLSLVWDPSAWSDSPLPWA